MVNNSVRRSTFNSRAAGFIPSSSSQSTSTSPTVPEAILSSVANVSHPAPSATSSTVVLSSMAPPLVSPDVLAAAVAQAIGNTLPAIVSALQSNSRPVNTAPPPCRFPPLADLPRVHCHRRHHWLNPEFLAWRRVQVGFRCLLLYPLSRRYRPLRRRALPASWPLRRLRCLPPVGPCPRLKRIWLCPFPRPKRLSWWAQGMPKCLTSW